GASLYSQLDYTFTAAGTYYLGVSAWSNFTYDPHFVASGTDAPADRLGDYRLSLSLLAQADVPDTIDTALDTGMGPLTPSYTMPMENIGNGRWGAKDVDMYKFTANAGERLTAQTSLPPGGIPADTVLRLFDNTGAELEFNDDYPP